MSQLIGTQPEIEVEVVALVTEGGKVTKIPFTAVYERIDRATAKRTSKELQDKIIELQKLAKEMVELEDGDSRREEIEEEIASFSTYEENLIRTYFKSFKNLKGADKKIIEYSDEMFEEMMNWDPYYQAFAAGFKKATGFDRENAKAKN